MRRAPQRYAGVAPFGKLSQQRSAAQYAGYEVGFGSPRDTQQRGMFEASSQLGRTAAMAGGSIERGIRRIHDDAGLTSSGNRFNDPFQAAGLDYRPSDGARYHSRAAPKKN